MASLEKSTKEILNGENKPKHVGKMLHFWFFICSFEGSHLLNICHIIVSVHMLSHILHDCLYAKCALLFYQSFFFSSAKQKLFSKFMFSPEVFFFSLNFMWMEKQQ